MGAPDVEGLTLPLSLSEHDHEWQPIQKTYADAQRFMEGQARQCPQLGEVNDEACQACLMFMSRALASGQDEHEARKLWPLSKIVTTCGTNLYDFFRELPVKAAVLEPFLAERGAKWPQLEASNHIREWQKTLITLTLLSKKFKDLATRFVPSTPVPRQAVLRLGWFLFLNIKAKLLPPFPDLVSCMTVLTCIINVLVAHAPSLPECLLAHQQAHAGQPLDTLHAICADLKLEVTTLTQQMAAVDSLIRHMLPSAVAEWRTSDRVHPAGAELKTHCGFFSGLLTNPSALQQCIEGLDREYNVLFQKKGEIDEREFLLRDFSSMASPRLSPTSLYNAAKRVHLSGPSSAGPEPFAGLKQSVPLGPGAFISGPSTSQRQPQPQGMRLGASVPLGLQSPVPSMRLVTAGPGATPVTEAMAAASWLRGILADAPTDASPQLRQHLEAAGGQAMVAAVSKRAWELADAAMPDERPAGPASVMGFPHVQSSLHALRRSEAVKLYYLALEAVVQGELLNGPEAVRLLLAAVKFHRGLMTCCLEVIITSFKMVSCNFPHVLDRLKLKAFDLSKVIQPFVKYMPSLPRELKRHLFVIEERILESLAWEPASPLYNLIVQAATINSAASKPSPAAATGGATAQPTASGATAGIAPDQGAPVTCDSQPAAEADTTMHPADAPEPAPSHPNALPSTLAQGASAGSTPQAPELTVSAQALTSAPASAAPGADRDEPMTAQGSSPPRHAAGGAGAASSPKRTHGVTQDLPSPLKKARCGDRQAAGEGGVAPLTLVMPEPLPLAVGRPVSGLLQEFLSKVTKLMCFRLALMVDSFDLAPVDPWVAYNSIQEVLEHALYQQTHLFYNRHVDQLVLSALYGYCKVHKLSKVSFKEIIAQYKRQPQATQAVFRSVNLEQGNPGLIPRGQADIIAFYNQCFVPVMKPFLLKTAQAQEAGAAVQAQQAHQGPVSSAHLGLPPIPPNPKHGPHMRVRRMSSPAPPAPAQFTAALQQQQQQPQRVLSGGTTFVLQAAPQSQGSGQGVVPIHSFFPQIPTVNRADVGTKGGQASAPMPIAGRGAGSVGSQRPDGGCEPMQTSLEEQGPTFVVGSAPAALTSAGSGSGSLDAAGQVLRWISCPQMTAPGAGVGIGAGPSSAFTAPAPLAIPRADLGSDAGVSRPPRKMPSGIAALLQALDSAEAQATVDQQQAEGDLGSAAVTGGLGSDTSSLASPACSTGNSLAPLAPWGQPTHTARQAGGAGGQLQAPGARPAAKGAEAGQVAVVNAVLPSAASPSSDDSSSPHMDACYTLQGPGALVAKSGDLVGTCSDQSCTPHD